MKKIIFLIVLVSVVIVGAMAAIFLNARSPVNNKAEGALQRAQNETEIASTEDVSLYNGKNSYVVITGENTDGEKIIVWVPEEDEEIIVKKWADGISKKAAINKLNEEEEVHEILSVKLGMESVGPVWELTYLDDNEHLNYYYLLFETGEWWRKIENL
ncbi:cell wall elongation regulator TseB-like domain-containing protein [Bacillus sp. AK031]